MKFAIHPNLFGASASAHVPLFVARVRTWCGILLLFILMVNLICWRFPPIGDLMPDGWQGMQANTAFCLFLAWMNAEMADNDKTGSRKSIQTVLAIALGVLVLNALASHARDLAPMPLDYLFVSQDYGDALQPVSLLSIVSIVLLFLIPFFRDNTTRYNRILFNTLLMLTCGLVLFFLASTVFQATLFRGRNQDVYISGYTLVSLMLLTAINAVNSTSRNFFSIFINKGAGGSVSRWALVTAVFTVLAAASLEVYTVFSDLLQPNAGLSLAITVELILMLMGISYLSGRTHKLTRDLQQSAFFDELTGVLNRRGFYLFAEHAMKEIKREKLNLKLFLFDLDGLKKVNDTLGHETGSAMIRAFATTLKDVFRSTDIVARMGGDEFVVLKKTSSATGREELLRLAKTLDARIDPDYGRINYSVGEVLIRPDTEQSLDELLHQADLRMYSNKTDNKAKSVADYMI
jgi:diguanylate cyclase (GGDEF)-like protein